MGYFDMIQDGLNNLKNRNLDKTLICFTAVAKVSTTDIY